MFRFHLKSSRPRLWFYLLGSFLIGALSSDVNGFFWPALTVFAFYFTYPANLLLHGLSSLTDYWSGRHEARSDKLHELRSASARKSLVWTILLWNIPFAAVWLYDDLPGAMKVALAGFLFLAVFYSLRPIRAKTKPFLDVLFSTVYIMPGLYAYGLLEYKLPEPRLIAAAALTCMTAYIYVRVSQVEVDEVAGTSSIATALRPRGALLLGALCAGVAAVLAQPLLGIFSFGAAAIYGTVLLVTFVGFDKEWVQRLYTSAPYLIHSFFIGLFAWIVLIAK